MSKTLSAFLTSVVFGTEGTQGVETGSYDFLWGSSEKDGLSMGEVPFDFRPLRGARGQVAASFRECQNLPGGDLGPAPLDLGTACGKFLAILNAHLQNVTVAGTEAPYTYTGSPATAAIEDGEWATISIIKDTGIANQAHLFTGCVVDELELSWKTGEPLMYAAKGIKAMAGATDGTMPTVPAPCAHGYLQAPRITCTWNGTEAYPASFKIISKQNFADKQSGTAKGRVGHVLGDYEASIELTVWRNEDSHTNWVNPFYTGAVGTLVVTGYTDSSLGTLTGGGVPTLTFTAYCKVEAPNDLNAQTGDLVDTVVLRPVVDTAMPTFTLTQESSTLL